MAPEVLREDQASSVLVLDQAPCHNTALLETKARQHGVTLVKIPKRMTALLQPADVCWLALIKRAFRARWQHWWSTATKSLTRHGNPRSPTYAVIIQWLSEIWSQFDPERIRESFDLCGITRTDCLHNALTKVLEGVAVTAYLEDRVEEPSDGEEAGEEESGEQSGEETEEEESGEETEEEESGEESGEEPAEGSGEERPKKKSLERSLKRSRPRGLVRNLKMSRTKTMKTMKMLPELVLIPLLKWC